MDSTDSLRKKKDETVREACELMDVRDILQKKITRLKSKKYSNPQVVHILERDLAAIVKRKGGYNERLTYLTYRISHDKRRKK